MENLNKYISVYKEQLAKGDIVIAYNELVKFVMKLRTDFLKNLSDQYAFAGVMHGYLDYTYFYYSNDFLKDKKLKFGLVLNHSKMRFEIWLLGNTVAVQNEYWELIKTTVWNKGKTEKPKYAIIETTLVNQPDFNDLNALAQLIETEMVKTSVEITDYIKSLN